MSCDDIQQYLKSVIQSEFIPYIPSRPRTLLSIISDCLHDEFNRYKCTNIIKSSCIDNNCTYVFK